MSSIGEGPKEQNSRLYRQFSERIEETWQDRFAQFFFEYRIVAYLILGFSAILLSLFIGADVALVAATSLLYLALLFVNLELKEIQEAQTEILERERRPHIEVVNVDDTTEPCSYYIANYGQSFATGLAIALKIQLPTETDLEAQTSFRMINRKSDDDYEFKRNDESIPPTDEPLVFEGDPLIRFSDQNYEVTDAVENLLDEGIGRINFQIALVYANSLGEVGNRILTDILTVDLEEGMSFRELMEDSFSLGGYERDVMFSQFDISEIIQTRDPEKLREPGLL